MLLPLMFNYAIFVRGIDWLVAESGSRGISIEAPDAPIRAAIAITNSVCYSRIKAHS